MSRRGDADLWYVEHVRPNERLFLSVARRLLRNADDARDVLQDVLTDIMSKERWRDMATPKAYLICAIRNRSLRILERDRIVPMYSMPDYESLERADRSPDPFAVLASRQELEGALSAIAGMPPQCRTVFTLRRIEGLPPRAVALRLRRKLSTIEKHFRRGIDRMQAHMKVTQSLEVE